MRFSSKKAYGRIHETLRDTFKELGVNLLRADDKSYSDDLFENIRLYADCCSFGVAVFDRIENDYFNPNVSLEVGLMIGRQKPILLLKDDTIQVLPTDLVGKLYVPLNIHEPEDGLKDRLRKWMDDNGINPCSKRLSVVVDLQIPRWEYSHAKDLIAGIPLFVSNAGPAYHKGIRKDDEFFVLDYDVSEKFSRAFVSMFQAGDFHHLAGISIVNVKISDEQTPLSDYIYVDRKTANYQVQYCFLESFDTCEDLAKRAKRYIGNLTRNVSECTIFISKSDDIIYCHSNYLLPGRIYPTKFLAKNINGIEFVLPLIINSKARSILEDDKLFSSHALHVTYICDDVFDGKPPFADMKGAHKIRMLKNES